MWIVEDIIILNSLYVFHDIVYKNAIKWKRYFSSSNVMNYFNFSLFLLANSLIEHWGNNFWWGWSWSCMRKSFDINFLLFSSCALSFHLITLRCLDEMKWRRSHIVLCNGLGKKSIERKVNKPTKNIVDEIFLSVYCLKVLWHYFLDSSRSLYASFSKFKFKTCLFYLFLLCRINN